ncbi:iron ascorbate-dependent oxidoreductase [Aureococcus anophagefferens]|nr:iron ascorbate-dependent oxidoreductase [Aureococcus anophagefferens]
MAAVLDDVNLERGLRATMTRDATTGRVPVIDMRADDAGARMWDAATTVGFFTVVNHGVDEETISAGFAASRAFFAQDQGEKERQSPRAAAQQRLRVHDASPAEHGTADRRSRCRSRREGAMDGRWPATPATFEADARALLGASRGLAARILDLLEQLRPRAGTLSSSHALWGAGGQCCLRLLHYPPADAVADDDATTWRAGPHTDWCCADKEAVIASKGGAITAGDYILGRIKSNFAKAN